MASTVQREIKNLETMNGQLSALQSEITLANLSTIQSKVNLLKSEFDKYCVWEFLPDTFVGKKAYISGLALITAMSKQISSLSQFAHKVQIDVGAPVQNSQECSSPSKSLTITWPGKETEIRIISSQEERASLVEPEEMEESIK